MKVYEDGNSVLIGGAIYHIFMLFGVASRGWAQVGVIDEWSGLIWTFRYLKAKIRVHLGGLQVFLHFTILAYYSTSQGLKISSFSFSVVAEVSSSSNLIKFAPENQSSPGYNVGSSRGAARAGGKSAGSLWNFHQHHLWVSSMWRLLVFITRVWMGVVSIHCRFVAFFWGGV